MLLHTPPHNSRKWEELLCKFLWDSSTYNCRQARSISTFLFFSFFFFFFWFIFIYRVKFILFHHSTDILLKRNFKSHWTTILGICAKNNISVSRQKLEVKTFQIKLVQCFSFSVFRRTRMWQYFKGESFSFRWV